MGEREFFIDNLLVRIDFVIEMIWWTGLAPWEFEFPFPGSLISISAFLQVGEVAIKRPPDGEDMPSDHDHDHDHDDLAGDQDAPSGDSNPLNAAPDAGSPQTLNPEP